MRYTLLPRGTPQILSASLRPGAAPLQLTPPSYTCDRQDGRQHGGIAVYLRDTLPFQQWRELDVQHLETVWITVELQRLPRGISNITIGLVYHLPGSKDKPMLDHISACIDRIEQSFPETAILLCGDFNQLKDARIRNDLQLKQLVKLPMWDKAILDKIYTNGGQYYGNPKVLPPVGLSDHNVVLCWPALVVDFEPPKTYMAQTCCTGANEKAMLLLTLRTTGWQDLYRAHSCEQQYIIFESRLKALINLHLPSKTMKQCTNDKPWVIDEFKLLTDRRHAAFRSNSALYPYLRNKTNWMRKRLRKNYFTSKISGLTGGGQTWWWSRR